MLRVCACAERDTVEVFIAGIDKQQESGDESVRHRAALLVLLVALQLYPESKRYMRLRESSPFPQFFRSLHKRPIQLLRCVGHVYSCAASAKRGQGTSWS